MSVKGDTYVKYINLKNKHGTGFSVFFVVLFFRDVIDEKVDVCESKMTPLALSRDGTSALPALRKAPVVSEGPAVDRCREQSEEERMTRDCKYGLTQCPSTISALSTGDVGSYVQMQLCSRSLNHCSITMEMSTLLHRSC